MRIRVLFSFYLIQVLLFHVFAQVGINTENPNSLTELEITNLVDNSGEITPKGIMIPRMSKTNIGKIDVSNTTNANSLLVYNTDEDCYNYYSKLEGEWKSLCGKLGKAEYTFDCSTIKVFGQYQNEEILTTANYIQITVDVTKTGSYSINALPDPENGYYFQSSGEFLTTGTFDIMLKGFGTPINFTTTGSSGDLIHFTLDGVESSCTTNIVIEDSSIKPDYTMSCSSVKVLGVYSVNKELDPTTNYIEVTINATAPYGATYVIETNTVEGIYFKGSGIITSGSQTVKLQGYGIPTNLNTKVVTLTSNSTSLSASTCTATVLMTYTPKSLFAFGFYQDVQGYLGQPGSALRKMIDAQVNFGNTENSTVRIQQQTANVQTFYPYDIISGTSAYTPSTVKQYLDTNPDIVLTGFDLALSTPNMNTLATYLVDYLKRKGTLIFICERQLMVEAFFKALYPDASGLAAVWNTDPTMSFSYLNDDVIKGPFGNVAGLRWGNDNNGASGISGLPNDGSYTVLSSSSKGVPNILKHNYYNLIFISEGGFNANTNGTTGDYGGGTSTSVNNPFAINSSFQPAPRLSFQGFTVYNSTFMANVLAWAIKQAQFNGINTAP